MAKAVIKEAVTSDFLASPDLVPRYSEKHPNQKIKLIELFDPSRTGKGFVGDAQLECGEGDKERSQQFMQSYALLHLKAGISSIP